MAETMSANFLASLNANQTTNSIANFRDNFALWNVASQLMASNIAFIVVMIGIAYWHTKFWGRKGIVGPSSKPFFGNLSILPLGNFETELLALTQQLREWAEKFGPAFGFQHGWQNVFVTSDPEAIKEVFVTKADAFTTRKYPLASSPVYGDPLEFRSAVLTAVNGKNLKQLIPTIRSACNGMVNGLSQTLDADESQQQKIVDLRESVHEVAWELIARMALGECNNFKPNNEEVERVIPLAKKLYRQTEWQKSRNGFVDVLDNYTWRFPLLTPLFRPIAKMLLPKRFGSKLAFEMLCDQLKSTNNVNESNGGNGKGELLDLIKTELLPTTGFETIADLLTLVLNALMRNEEIQSEVRQEIIGVFGLNDEIVYEKLNQLKLTEAVISETLRLYPMAVINTDRVTAREVTLSGGHHIPKGIVVKANIQSVHLQKEIWGLDAEIFNPKRWLDPAAKEIKNQEVLAWFPFGAGKTICPGARFVLAMVKIGLVSLLRELKFEFPAEKKPMKLVMKDEAAYCGHFRGLYMYPEGATAKVSRC